MDVTYTEKIFNKQQVNWKTVLATVTQNYGILNLRGYTFFKATEQKKKICRKTYVLKFWSN